MFRKNLKDTGPRCPQCGKPATVKVRNRGITTAWCETHSPDLWQLCARERRAAENRWRTQDPETWRIWAWA